MTAEDEINQLTDLGAVVPAFVLLARRRTHLWRANTRVIKPASRRAHPDWSVSRLGASSRCEPQLELCKCHTDEQEDRIHQCGRRRRHGTAPGFENSMGRARAADVCKEVERPMVVEVRATLYLREPME